MGIYMREALVWAFALALAIGGGDAQNSSTLVPAIITFGDSAVDVGNNDYIPTIFKANYPPYGRDFVNHKPTGRFCNGKLATDITADTLGFTTYPPAYLSPQASGKNLLIGANFASAASGYDDKTAVLNVRIISFSALIYWVNFFIDFIIYIFTELYKERIQCTKLRLSKVWGSVDIRSLTPQTEKLFHNLNP
ncbi:hypothetical protein CsSME_00052179 [Camellia sinensis var. sinensis]